MMRRLLIALALVFALVVATPAAGDNDLHSKKAEVDARIATLHSRVQTVRRKEDALRSQIDALSSNIQKLEAQVGDVSAQLTTLENDLALHQERLRKLNELYTLRQEKLSFMRSQYRASVDRLNQRLVDIYESEQSDMLGVVLSADSFESLLDQVDYVKIIGEQDRRIAGQVRKTRDDVARQLAATKHAKRNVIEETQAIAVRTQQKRLVRDQLVSSRSQLASSRDRKRTSLDELSAEERAQAEEIDALQAQSANLAAQIQAAQASAQQNGTSPPAANPGGFQWPVSGPVTSPFGWRWGRMHEGIDIAVSTGTPVHASAAGTIIYAGWMSGYGNLVVIDHGGGVATAYGHNSSLAVAVGQHVSQGQVISYAGSTGHSTGPHVHFEVRVNGSPRDPLGYL